MEQNNFLSPSFLNGKYKDICGLYDVEINTSLSFAYFENQNDENESYFFNGDEADDVINEINTIYNTENVTNEKAIEIWINKYL